MDNTLFLQELRDLSLEDGRAFIQEHASQLEDHAVFGELLADEALNQLYTPFVSLKVAELLIYFGEYVSHVSSHALGLKAKGDALVQIGHFQAAMECLDAAGKKFLRLGDKRNWARSRISWIISSAWLGHVEEALLEAGRARDVFLQLGEPYWVCAIDHNMAMIYDYVGRYQDALKLYENMLAIYPTLADQNEISIKQRIALAEMNYAIHLAWLGNFEQAHNLLRQAQASFFALEETDLIINSEVNLADLDYMQGYYGSALRRYFQARDSLLQSPIDDPLLLAELKLWIANCLVKLNRAHEACLLSNEAVETYKQFGISLNTGIALREYAITLLADGRLREALTALNEAWILFEGGGFEHHASATKLQEAEALLKIGSFAEAYDQASLIREYFETQGLVSRSVHASLVMAEALIEILQQDKVGQEKEQQATILQKALLLCKKAVLQARQHNLQEEVYKSYYLLGRLFAFRGNSKRATRYYIAAIAQIQRILHDLVYDLSPSFLYTAWKVYEDMIAQCLMQAQFERAFSYLEQARSIALRQYLNKSNPLQSKSQREEQADATPSTMSQVNSAIVLRIQYELRDCQEEYRRYSVLLGDSPSFSAVNREIIQAELRRCEGKISELFERLQLYQSHTCPIPQEKKRAKSSSNHVNITQLRQQLASNQLLLAYFLYEGRLVIFAATTEHLVTYENLDGVAQLELLLPLLHDAHLEPGGWPDTQHPPQQAIRRLLNKLYKLLIAPIADMLPPQSGYLTIVPYGPLHKLPFHALHDGSHFLIEDYQVNYLPASNMLTHFGIRKNEQMLCPIDASISTQKPLILGYSENGQLERIVDEAKMLTTILDGRCYLEREATIARLVEQAPGSPIIHLATHGHSRLDAPNFSYMLLADGQLNAIDALSLDLKRCELVTLSGCETGLALSGGGDEQLGLGRAFLAAGAETLVMSLWSVEDNATNELMQLFYQRLLHGDTKVQALRAAQCAFLHHTSSRYTHPYFWAAFRLVGDTGPLSFVKAR
jgi:hypothetical protein